MFTPSSSSSSPPLSLVSLLYYPRRIRGGELNLMMMGPSWSSSRFIWLTPANHNTQQWHPLTLLPFQPSLGYRAARSPGHARPLKFISLSLTDRNHTERSWWRYISRFSEETKSAKPPSLPPCSSISNLTHITLFILQSLISLLFVSLCFPHMTSLSDSSSLVWELVLIQGLSCAERISYHQTKRLHHAYLEQRVQQWGWAPTFMG